MVQLYGKRQYLKLQDVTQFAEEYFDKTGKGINFSLLQRKFGLSKSKAQRILKISRNNHLLFTPKNTKPQTYYPKTRHFQVIEHIKQKNVPVDTTGTSNLQTNNSDYNSNQKTNFLESLTQLPLRPLQIHKIQIETTIDTEAYTLIHSEPWKGNLGRQQIEHIDNKDVTYIYYRNGKVSISIACSNNPFNIETEDDLISLCSFFGQVRDRFQYQISDPRGRLVPQITDWILKQSDFNKDIPITDIGQLSLPNIQLTTAFTAFRLYVKNLEGNAFYRCEDSRVVNQSLGEFLNSNLHINPNPNSNPNSNSNSTSVLVVGQIKDRDKQDNGPNYYYC